MDKRLMAVTVVAFATALLAAGPPPASQSPSPPPFVGQWVWTRTDAELHAQAAKRRSIAAAVFVATVTAEGDRLRLRRALSPRVTEAGAIVVRLEDSVHGLWPEREPHEVAAELATMLAGVLAEAEATGADIEEVQLDYDAPVRRLGAWSAVVRELSGGPLKHVRVWVTSIPAHLADPHYGTRFAGAIEGHILQLFDTGLHCTATEARVLARQVEQRGLPYRIGLGAFERGAATEHGCWFRRWRQVAGPRFAGLWVFPAGNPYLELLR
jgi:hypothetical protein